MDAKTKIYSDLNTHDHNFPVLLVNNKLVKEDKDDSSLSELDSDIPPSKIIDTIIASKNGKKLVQMG